MQLFGQLFFPILIYLTQTLKKLKLSHFFANLFGRLEKIPVLCNVKINQSANKKIKQL